MFWYAEGIPKESAFICQQCDRHIDGAPIENVCVIYILMVFEIKIFLNAQCATVKLWCFKENICICYGSEGYVGVFFSKEDVYFYIMAVRDILRVISKNCIYV